MSEYTAIVKQDGDWWIGWIEEVPGVNCQEASRDALLETLRITLEEALRSQPRRRTLRSLRALRGSPHRCMKRRALERWPQRARL